MTAAMLLIMNDPLTEPERQILSSMASDLQFLLSESEVPLRLQHKLAELRYKTMAAFTVMADDRPSMRTTIGADILDPSELGLTPQQAAEARLYGNYILSAWIIAGQRLTEEIRMGAESKSLRLPSIIPRTSLIALRQRFEREHGRVPDAIYPCSAMIEKRLSLIHI